MAAQVYHSEELIVNNTGKCPICSQKVFIDSNGDGQLIKGRIVKFVDNGVSTKCKGCGKFVLIPFTMIKSLAMPMKLYGKNYKVRISKEFT